HRMRFHQSPVLLIGEEQPKNRFTELQVLKGHFDIVRFLVQIDDFRCASAGDDALVLIWSVETGERLQELRGHTQQITAITTFSSTNGVAAHASLITASSDRSLSLWDPDTGNRVQTISDLQSSVKCLLVLERQCVWISGGEELCVWSKDFQLQSQRQTHSDNGITALIELPKNCIAAAMDKDIMIYRLTVSTDSSVSVAEIRCLSNHQDQIRSLITVNDGLFASGSHAGELVVWDAVEWNMVARERILWEEPQAGTEIRLGAAQPSEVSIQHLSTNGKLIVAAVGGGLYVYNVLTRSVLAYRKQAHDSNVLHTSLLDVMSCSEDGSVRMWEIQEQPLMAEATSAGLFGGMWSFGRSNKSSVHVSKKTPPDSAPVRTLELTGDLIGHSGAVQMFISFNESALVTCSTDHLLILWKDGQRESQRRSLALLHKLEEKGGL
uniref:WD repeat domain 41 n=1 Tax=Gouania willdenowi TaxID=441366 RepID=A0A8C5E3D5_GOUWI